MALPKLSPTKFRGVSFFADSQKGKVFVATTRIDGKLNRKVIGWSNDEFRTNEKTAFIKREKWLVDIKSGLYEQIENLKTKKIYTYNLLFDEYLEIIKYAQSEKTVETKVYYHNKHIKNILGHKLLSKISNIDIQKMVNDMLKKGYKPQTAKHLKNIIKATLSYAIERKIIDDNVAEKVQIPKFDNKVEFNLSVEECKTLFDTIINYDEEIYRNIFIFLIHGRRKNEVLKMKWDCIDLVNKTYEVPAEINKVRKNLRYPITDLLYEMLVSIEDKNGFVFKNPDNGKSFNDIRKAWERIKLKAHILKPMRIHDIRHLIGNIVVNNLEVSSSIAAAILGHSSTQMVDKRYSSVRVETINRGLNNIFEFLKK